MTGESNLHILLKTLDPVLDERRFGFCAIKRQSTPVLGFKPLGIFEEEEGATIIATIAELESADLKFSGPWAKISLRVHSSLTAVGLTAAVATALAGGCFLVLCDAFARTVFAPVELPVGVVTALLGGPFFLWLLRRRSAGWLE